MKEYPLSLAAKSTFMQLAAAFLLIIVLISPASVDNADDITSTDVFYLSKAIDDSLVEMHNLYTTFHKNREDSQ